jgi:MSHA type pilus biogenesis protein MshL
MKKAYKIAFTVFLIICNVWTPAGAQAPQPDASMQTQGASAAGADKISLDLKGMDVVEVVKMLATKGNLNVVIGPDVKGRVTIFLKSVDVMDALDIVLIANDLAYDRRGDIIYIMTQRTYEALYGEKYADKKEEKIFQLKYAKASDVAKALNQMKTKMGKVVVDDGSNTIVVIDSPAAVAQESDAIDKLDMPTVTKIFELKYAKAADMKTKITESLTKGVGTVQIDERTNKLVVTDLERKMGEITAMVTAFDDKLEQVLIEAKILEITLDDHYQLGVDWDSVFRKLQKEISFKSVFQLAAAGAWAPGAQLIVGALNTGSDYAVMIQILKTIGDTNLLSSPRITALNNQEAKILVGTSSPYATNTVTQGTSTTTTGANLSFLDIGVKLYVTPTINKDKFITMKIKPEVSSQSGSYSYYTGSTTQATTVPIVSTTQAETSVTVKDGMTIVIGGLIRDERTSTVYKIPVLGDIPVLGAAFKKTDKEVKKKELVIFLTPHIVTGDADYLETPKTPPIGEKKFTEAEKPAFEARKGVAVDPGYLQDKEKGAWDKQEGPAPQKPSSAARPEKRAGPAMVMPTETTADQYFLYVKKSIVNNLRYSKTKSKQPKIGNVKIEFILSPDGEIAEGPSVIKSSNPALEGESLAAVVEASPFPAFPDLLGKTNKRFVIDLSFE